MKEMDKSEDVRRGSSRFSKQSSSGLEKSKKERIKKLSAVNNSIIICEMGCNDVSSDREDHLLATTAAATTTTTTSCGGGVAANNSKRFKLPRKQFFDGCNGVDHASVPRKLRSAMRKRNCESVSPPFPDSKKLNHATGGVESPERDGLKKLKLNVKQGGPDWSLEHGICGPITKDEEEVVETLYALAEMFSENEPNTQIKLECSENNLALPDAAENPQPAVEGSLAVKEDFNSICLLKADEENHSASNEKGSAGETHQVGSLNETTVHGVPNLSNIKKLQGESGSSSTQLNLLPTFAKHEEQKTSCGSINFCVAPELYQDTSKLKWPMKLEMSPIESKPAISLDLITSIGSQQRQLDTIHESNKNGLSSMVSGGAWSYGPSPQSSAAKIPTWLDASLNATRPDMFQNGSSIGKVPKVGANRRSWKRCSAHVHISHLIQDLQSPDIKDSLLVHTHQMRPEDILKQGVFMTINDFYGVRNGLKGVNSVSSTINTHDKNSNEARSGIIQPQKQLQNHALAGIPSGAYMPKQSFNFLSLSAGVGPVNAKSSSNGAGNGLEAMAQLQIPFANPHVQHPTLMPFSISQAPYSSSAFPDQPSAAPAQQNQLQLPPYLGTPFCGDHTSPTSLKKQQLPQHQQQQQQQRLWAAQLAAQYRITGISSAMTQFPSWQNGRQDPTTVIPCARAIVSPSPSSIDKLGPKYAQISQQQQQQQFVTIPSSLPHARVKRQDRSLSSVYEETGGGFRTGGALPLQLLCNEHL